jgi:hypothetical protein
MDPFDTRIHVSWYHALDTEHVHILVKFERRLSISVPRNKPFFTKKKNEKKGLRHPFGKIFVSPFSPKLGGLPALKFDKDLDVLCIYCMVPRSSGFLG